MTGIQPMARCPRCGRTNPADASFCMGCGLRLEATPANREVRKTVTAVCCDLVGSTTLGERHDPEVLRPLWHAYFQGMRAAIERHGGSVEKFIGDAVVGIFGIPVAHEDDAIRAVRAAAEMTEHLAALAAGAAIPLACRIGVNTGEVFVPASDEPIVGDAINTASRLQASATPGWILIGEPTHALVRDLVLAERVEDLRLKGKAKPVPAWRLLRVIPGSTDAVRRRDLPMVGRQDERAALEQTYAVLVEEESSRLVTVLGAAGVGKSRLIEEFLATSVGSTATVLRGRCLPYGEGITYWPIGEVVRQLTGITESDDADTAMDRLRRFADGLPEGPTIARGLGGLAGLDGRVPREELLWAFRRALEHLATTRPVVLVIEDVHWAEATLLDFIETLVALVRTFPILVLCEARSELLEDRPGWGRADPTPTIIRLEPLADDETRQLITTLAAGHDLTSAMQDRVTAAAEGNPLYVHEFVAMLADAGAPPPSDGTTVTGLGSVAIPPTIQALLSARLDRLSHDERAVAERASVIGRSFDTAALLALSPPNEAATVTASLEGLARTQLIGPDPAARTFGQFRFGHQLIRDAAYDRLPKAERAILHERFADWLDRSAGSRIAEVEEIIGYHLERAFRYREELGAIRDDGRAIAHQAAERLAAAGRRAFERSDIAAAVNLLERSAALLEPDDPFRLALLPDLARALDSNGRFDEARACLDDVVERSQAVGDELALAYARVVRCVVFEREATLEGRLKVADECFEVFERHGEDRGLALCWRLRGAASWQAGWSVGDDVALAKALEHARRAGAHREEVLIADGLSSSLTLGPTPVPDGIRRCEEILTTAPGDRGIEMAMSHALAHLYARVGAFDRARPLALRCRTIAAQSGQRAHAAHLTEVAWDVETLAGDHAAAERIIEEGCAGFRAMGKTHPMLEAFLALSQAALGRMVDVERLREMARQEHQATRALLEHAIAVVLLQVGRLDEAESSARSAVDYFMTTDLLTMEADATLGLGDVLLAEGRIASALEVLGRTQSLYRRKGNLVGLAAVAVRSRAIAGQR